MNTINYGIDLGTTNSGIGRFENGRVQILKNPVGLKETLPSVVSFYRGRILVGDKAREQLLSNTGAVFNSFKRKMGTGEVYERVDGEQNNSITPIELSAQVLKALKNYTGDTSITAAVITIPASFDTIQSNATKQAGYEAGLKEVILLQEPIAACLAYANQNNLDISAQQYWLVYDFGGGTFDAALIDINQRVLKIIDNRGNNFLGGVDIDHAFIADIIVPKLMVATDDDELQTKLTSNEPLYRKLWHYLNYLTEECKKDLSMSPSSWIEIDFPELDLFLEIEVTRDELNQVVRPKYQESEQLVWDLLTENNLAFSDINRIILVGGTTYIPFIKQSLAEISGVLVDNTIDPTTAVIVGAAYYAGAHERSVEKLVTKEAPSASLSVNLSFEQYSNDLEELVAFRTAKPVKGFYRLVRSDGGFDSGWREFDSNGSEFVTLLPKARNQFNLSIADKAQVILYENNNIQITHGLYSVSGQVLPEDICIELDDEETGTYLEVIFKRNAILPLSKTLYKSFSKTILKNTDNKIVINVVEGKGGTLPGSNLSIGYLEISGRDIENDLIQGTDIELQIEMDESRGLSISIYIPSTYQQIDETFHLAQRTVSVDKLLKDIALAESTVKREIANSNQKEAYELSAMFQKIEMELKTLKVSAIAIKSDQATEEKFRLDERKRKLLIELDDLTRGRNIYLETVIYKKEKESYFVQEQYATDRQKQVVKKLFDVEKEFLQSGDKHLIKQKAAELRQLNNEISLQNIETFISVFWRLATMPDSYFIDKGDFTAIIDAGKEAIQQNNLLHLKQIVVAIYNKLLPEHRGGSTASNGNISIDTLNQNTFKTGLR